MHTHVNRVIVQDSAWFLGFVEWLSDPDYIWHNFCNFLPLHRNVLYLALMPSITVEELAEA